MAGTGLLTHLGCEVELDCRLTHIEVTEAEKAEDQGLVFGKGCDLFGAQAEIFVILSTASVSCKKLFVNRLLKLDPYLLSKFKYLLKLQ